MTPENIILFIVMLLVIFVQAHRIYKLEKEFIVLENYLDINNYEYSKVDKLIEEICRNG